MAILSKETIKRMDTMVARRKRYRDALYCLQMAETDLRLIGTKESLIDVAMHYGSFKKISADEFKKVLGMRVRDVI